MKRHVMDKDNYKAHIKNLYPKYQLKIFWYQFKMTMQKDPELIPSNGQTKPTALYEQFSLEKKNWQTELPPHIKKTRGGIKEIK